MVLACTLLNIKLSFVNTLSINLTYNNIYVNILILVQVCYTVDESIVMK